MKPDSTDNFEKRLSESDSIFHYHQTHEHILFKSWRVTYFEHSQQPSRAPASNPSNKPAALFDHNLVARWSDRHWYFQPEHRQPPKGGLARKWP